MLSAVKPVSNLLTVKPVNISDICFRLSTKITASIMVLFSILVSTQSIYRSSIDCYAGSKESDRKGIMDNYCWSVGTYICKSRDIFGCFNPKEAEKVTQDYYQWIPLIFIAQAMISYLPFYVWKVNERGLLVSFCSNTDKILSTDSYDGKKKDIINFFSNELGRRSRMRYTTRYIICNVLSTSGIVINMAMLSMIIPEYWSSYSKAVGAVLVADSAAWSTHSEFVFPKMVKCLFEYAGPSGSVQEMDSLCLLPLNVINQKVFAIVFVWLWFQLILSLYNLFYWAVICYSKSVRIAILRQQAYVCVSRKVLLRATNNGSLGDFFVLHQIGRNVTIYTFIDLVTDLSLKDAFTNDTILESEKSI